MNTLSWEVLNGAENLETHNDLLEFLGEIREKCGDVTAEGVFPFLDSVNSNEQATAFLACAAWDLKPGFAPIEGALTQESSTLTAAAALCAVTCLGEQEAFIRKLLLGPDGWSPSQVSPNARHFLILAMGTSGEARYVDRLLEALHHPHFCRGQTIARALKLLGQGLGDEEEELLTSVPSAPRRGGERGSSSTPTSDMEAAVIVLTAASSLAASTTTTREESKTASSGTGRTPSVSARSSIRETGVITIKSSSRSAARRTLSF